MSDQWWVWEGGVKVALNLRGVWNGTSIDAVTGSSTEVSRFSGDPGPGKCYIGGNRTPDPYGSGGNEIDKYNWWVTHMSAATSTVSGPVARIPHIQKIYGATDPSGDSPSGDTTYTSTGHTQAARTNNLCFSRKLLQMCKETGQISLHELNFNTSIPGSGGVLFNTAMASVWDQINIDGHVIPANFTGDALTAYNYLKNTILAQLDTDFRSVAIWWCDRHEVNKPTSDGGVGNTTSLTNEYRKAIRAWVLCSRYLGYTNLAHFVPPYITNNSFPDHGTALYDWRLYCADYRFTGLSGDDYDHAFAHGFNDWYTNTTKVGNYDESVVDIVGHDIYYWANDGDGTHDEWSADTTTAHADAFTSDTQINLQWRADFDRGWNRYGGLGKPVVIAETGTQAAGYYTISGSTYTLQQRTADHTAMTNLALDLSEVIEAGQLVGIAYFNKGDQIFGYQYTDTGITYKTDPNFSKCDCFAELWDRYSLPAVAP